MVIWATWANRHQPGIWYTDYGAFNIDSREGCRQTKVPGMVEWCIDHAAARGHFRFDHQRHRRCFMKKKAIDTCDLGPRECSFEYWEELACTWIHALVEPEATASAAGPLSTVTDSGRVAVSRSVEGGATTTAVVLD
jgi:hypothetical protein